MTVQNETQLDIILPPGGRLSAGQLHSAMAVAARDDQALVDLRLAQWVEPLGLVAIAVFAERQTRSDRSVVLLGPHRPDLARYLSRMRLGHVLESLDQDHDLPSVNEWDTGSRLVELRRFTGRQEPDALAAMLYQKTRSAPPVADALHQCVAEIGANVPEHSGQDWGYVAAQTTYGDTLVQFAVGDAGRGVAAGFLPERQLTDQDALELTLQKGISRTGLTGHGKGLQKARRLVTDLKGSLHMISGTAYRTTHARSTSFGSASTLVQGTLLQGTFAVPRTHPDG